jgi:hypothetical protein
MLQKNLHLMSSMCLPNKVRRDLASASQNQVRIFLAHKVRRYPRKLRQGCQSISQHHTARTILVTVTHEPVNISLHHNSSTQPLMLPLRISSTCPGYTVCRYLLRWLQSIPSTFRLRNSCIHRLTLLPLSQNTFQHYTPHT